MNILVVNAGSSSLKLRVVGPDDDLVATRDIATDHGPPDPREFRRFVEGADPIGAVGHRVVHGGSRFTSAVAIDETVEAQVRTLSDLAPLHQPSSLAALEVVSKILPRVPAVACFDTAFHATLPEAAATYAIPPEWREVFGVRRYGFHGLSHAYASRRACELLRRSRNGTRQVTCHLGAGCSLAAVSSGRSVDTTMGFTPLEGLVMATRSGSVDPGLVLWLQQHADLSADEVAEGLESRSGLLGLAGAADMREVLRASDAGEPGAVLALGVYLHRLRAAIAAMAAAMDGLDVLVFTGGVGENAPSVRKRAVDRMGFLGLAIDPERNEGASGDADISAGGASAKVVLVRSREDLEIARQVRHVMAK